jgi:drug/metabolite transporter (DMT)-like permease
VVGRSVGQSLPLQPYLGLVHVGAAALLFAVAPGLEGELWPDGATTADLWALVYLGLVPGVVGHGLLNWAVRYVPVHVVALAILFEPVGATVLTVLVLGHAVGTGEAIGAGVLLLGVGLGLPRRRAG